jgi:tripartite-type tricarboxylate transporter receptor subunit TctC
VNEGLATPDLQNKLKRLGGEAQPKSVAEFGAFIADQYKRWGEVIRITGVTLN